MKSRYLLAASAAVCLVLSGCASSSGDAWETPRVPDPVPSFAETQALPFDAYALSPAIREQLQLEHARLLSGCLAEYGMTAVFAGDYIQQVSDDPENPYWFQWGGRPGFRPMDQVQTYAYAQAPGTPWVNGSGFYISSPVNIFPVQTGDPISDAKIAGVLFGPENASIPGSTGPAERLPADEVPRDSRGALPDEGGCYAAIEKKIDIPYIDLRPLESEVLGLALHHDAVSAVNAQWVACMESKGYQYARFDEPMNDAQGMPTREKIDAATADAKCTEESGWPDVFYDVLGAYQRQAIDRQPDLFPSALSAETERLERMQELIDAG